MRRHTPPVACARRECPTRGTWAPARFSAGEKKSKRPFSITTEIVTRVVVVVAIPAGLTPIGTLGNLVSIGTLMAVVIVSLGIIVLRRTRPDLPRPHLVW